MKQVIIVGRLPTVSAPTASESHLVVPLLRATAWPLAVARVTKDASVFRALRRSIKLSRFAISAFECLDAGRAIPVSSIIVGWHGQFAYHQSMDAENVDTGVSRIASAIAEPTRTRMLYCLLDGRARTSTELAVVAGVSPGTASVHLNRLREERLVNVVAQGKHRYYSLGGADVAAALEALSVVAGVNVVAFEPSTPEPLRAARTCYDHLAGTVGVSLHDRFKAMGWLKPAAENGYDLSADGLSALTSIGIDVRAARNLRRRFAFACLDWSERRPHIGGALGAALLKVALQSKWLTQDLDSRAVRVSPRGSHEMKRLFGLRHRELSGF
jgi:DNA-binding transcriptional ArsR family regulator